MSDTYDRMFLAAADHGDLAMTSDGYRWDGRPVDVDTAARITALLDTGLLAEKSPGADYTLLKPTGSAVPR
jgi:hypothetical protein